MTISAEKILKEACFGERIKIILTEILLPTQSQSQCSFMIHYLERDEESLEYVHVKEDKALEDFTYLSKVAQKELRHTRRKSCLGD